MPKSNDGKVFQLDAGGSVGLGFFSRKSGDAYVIEVNMRDGAGVARGYLKAQMHGGQVRELIEELERWVTSTYILDPQPTCRQCGGLVSVNDHDVWCCQKCGLAHDVKRHRSAGAFTAVKHPDESDAELHGPEFPEVGSPEERLSGCCGAGMIVKAPNDWPYCKECDKAVPVDHLGRVMI